jgi:hypothetical protein
LLEGPFEPISGNLALLMNVDTHIWLHTAYLVFLTDIANSFHSPLAIEGKKKKGSIMAIAVLQVFSQLLSTGSE